MTNLRPNRTIVKALSQKTKGGRKRTRRQAGREGRREGGGLRKERTDWLV